MKSPFTGKEMERKLEHRFITFRKEKFEILYHYYYCKDYDEQITDPALEEININQVYNQYRSKYNLPFPDEIRGIREKYDLKAANISTLLGFGINTYKNYENGEVPSEANGKLIQLSKDPSYFKHIISLDPSFNAKANEKLLKKIDTLIAIAEDKKDLSFIQSYIFGKESPSEFSGFKNPNMDLMTEMVVYFTENLKPHKKELSHMLFHADFLQYRKTCFSISGSKYHNIENLGPVPDNVNTLYEFISNNKDIKVIIDNLSHGLCERFIPTRHFRKDLFDDIQLETMHTVMQSYLKHGCSIRIKDTAVNSADENHLSYNLGLEEELWLCP
jgi:putative zinc finger/helix-turn-helix YgiT family protein